MPPTPKFDKSTQNFTFGSLDKGLLITKILKKLYQPFAKNITLCKNISLLHSNKLVPWPVVVFHSSTVVFYCCKSYQSSLWHSGKYIIYEQL
jgi:hypothetical protein